MESTIPGKYKEEFKIRAVWLVFEGILNMSEASKILNVSRSSLARWSEQYRHGWEDHKNLLYRNLDASKNTNKNIYIIKTMLANGELSIKNYNKLQGLIADQALLAEKIEPLQENSFISTQQSATPRDVDTSTALLVTPDAFKFIGLRKNLFYFLFFVAAFNVFVLIGTLLWVILDSDFSAYIANNFFRDFNGIVFRMLFDNSPHSRALDLSIIIISISFYIPLILVTVYFAKLRTYKRKQTIQLQNQLITLANQIISIGIPCIILNIQMNLTSAIQLSILATLYIYIFYPIAKKK